MADQQIRIVISADPSAAQAGLQKVDQSLQKTAARSEISAKQTAAAMRGLPAQFTDIAVQLQGGASPLTVLLQQGGQIKDQFGSLGGALRGVGGFIGPLLTNPLTLAAGAAIALGSAFLKGSEESGKLTRAIIESGNAVGVTTDQLSQMADAIDAVGGTRSGAAELLASIARDGGVAADMMQRVATTAIQLEKVGGPAAEETAKAFSSLGRDPVNASKKLNESTNFLTATLYKQIKALQDQGRNAEAAALAQTAYADALDQRLPKLNEQLGLIERGWNGIKTVAAEAWDSMLNIGRADTLEEQLKKAKKAQAEFADIRDTISGGGNSEAARAARAEQDQIIAGIEEQIRLQNRAATEAKQRKQETDKAIQDASEGHQNALANIDKAGAAKILAQQSLRLGTAKAIYDNAYAREQITKEDHARAMQAIDLARLDSEEANLNRLKAIEAKRGTTGRDDELAKQAALQGFETQRLGIQEKRVALLMQEADVQPYLTGGNQFAQADDSAAILARVQASRDAQKQITDATEQLNASQIKDAEARGRALIDIEARQIRERLDLASLGDDARKQAEDELAAYIEARTAELVDGLKPNWERMVEDYQDSAKLIRESNDTIMTGILKDSEDAWVQWSMTGKFSARTLVNNVLAEMARLQFRQLIGSSGGDSSSGLLGLISSAIGGSSAGADVSTIQAGSGTYNFADAIRGNRASGGPVDAGGLYAVNELGSPELLTVGNRSYLMMGNQSGNVTANPSSGAISVTINQTVGDVVTSAQLAAVAERTRQAAIAGVSDARMRGRA